MSQDFSQTKEIEDYIEKMPDEVLSRLQFSINPWQSDPDTGGRDSDGFNSGSTRSARTLTRAELQEECWTKVHENPQINTAVRGKTGRMVGFGFETTSMNSEINQAIEDTELDHRNRLWNYWPKYVNRSNVEGELFLGLTCHNDGFVEVDFIDPSIIAKGGDEDTGIIFHPSKSFMPLFYNIDKKGGGIDQVPSVFVARYPELANLVSSHKSYDIESQKTSRDASNRFKKFGGFFRFVVSWDKSFITRRTYSYLRTTLKWINHYENLKQYEIDHKKSSGAYLWVITIEDPKAFKLWLKLSDEERRKTGIMSKKTPGGTLVLPPGMKLQCINPNLTSIKDQDTDILHMVTSGLDEASDVTTGVASGSYAATKATRAPMSDRISDDIAYFERFLRFDFWGNVFFLKQGLGVMKQTFKKRRAIKFDDKGKPVFGNAKVLPEQLIDFSFPVSETTDLEALSKSFLGTKHGPLAETLGIPNSKLAAKMGFGGYGRLRLQKATEDELYPELVYTTDAEAIQEKAENVESTAAKSV